MSRYYNSHFDDFDGLYLEHFGVKGMKWKNHVYKIKDGLKTGGKFAVNTAKGLGAAVEGYGNAVRSGSKYATDKFRKAKKHYKGIKSASSTQYEIGKKAAKRRAGERAVKGGRPDIENKIYQNKVSDLKNAKKIRDSKALPSTLKYVGKDVAKDIKNANAKRKKERDDYNKMVTKTEQLKRSNKRKLKGTNLADYNKNRALKKSGFYKTTRNW